MGKQVGTGRQGGLGLRDQTRRGWDCRCVQVLPWEEGVVRALIGRCWQA